MRDETYIVCTVKAQNLMVGPLTKAPPRMLVVDDHELVQYTLQRWFQAQGFDVDVACNGQAAVEKCRAARYDVITMDLEMPLMNGIEATAAIRALYPDVPIIVLTGYSDRADEASQCGATAVVGKPIAPSELEGVVRRVMPSQDTPS